MVPEPMLRSVKLDTSVIFPHYQSTAIPSRGKIQVEGTYIIVLLLLMLKRLLWNNSLKWQIHVFCSPSRGLYKFIPLTCSQYSSKATIGNSSKLSCECWTEPVCNIWYMNVYIILCSVMSGWMYWMVARPLEELLSFSRAANIFQRNSQDLLKFSRTPIHT